MAGPGPTSEFMSGTRRWGALGAMLVAVVIYGGQFGFVRQGLAAGLTPADIAGLRYLLAGGVMLPVFLWLGASNCAGLGWGRGLVLVLLGGLPLVIATNVGMQWAPAAHAAALQPGTVALTGTLLGAFAAGRRVSARVASGIAVVLGGLLMIAIAGTRGEAHAMAPVAYVIFVTGGVGWAFFTYVCARWQVEPLAGTSVVSLGSALLVPVFWPFFEHRWTEVAPTIVATQAVYQGVLVVVVGMVLWTYGARSLGTAIASRFPPLVPVFGALLAVPIAGEIPGSMTLLGICAIVAGLTLAATSRR